MRLGITSNKLVDSALGFNYICMMITADANIHSQTNNFSQMNMKFRLTVTNLLIISSLILPLSCGNQNRQVQSETQEVNDDFEFLMEKIRKDFAQNPSIDEALELYNDEDGTFSDVDYSNTERTNWAPLTHVQRLSDFAFAYTNPENKYHKDEALFEKIRKGLEFWHERDPWCSNWWHNQISEPQTLGVLLIQMRVGEKRLDTGLEEKILERIKQDASDPAKWTGANRTDIALHWIYRSCLSRNEKDLIHALENVYNPVVYTTEEGFQHDNSYFQHGPQLYIGGYGDEILKGVTQVATYTKGTKYEMPQDQVALLSKFMRETYYQTIRGKFMLFDVLGRGVSRPGITDKSKTALFAERMIVLDPDNAGEFRDIIARLEGKEAACHAVKPKHTHYFRADYSLHVRPGYTFDVRTVSDRTSRCEYGNNENLKTYFMSDGCTNITIEGDEYERIFPVWNWARIPGTTAPQMPEIPKAAKAWQDMGTSTFTGGVSDSLYGVTAYSYYDSHSGIDTGARKAWFFFDDEIVCLGAGINSSSEYPVFTTINQCLSSGEALICSGKEVTAIDGADISYDSPEWVLHDKVGYVLPEGQKVVASASKQCGRWYDINLNHTDELVEAEVFTLCLDHGTAPGEGTYSYIVVPGIESVKDLQKYCRKSPVEILANNAGMQVVRNSRKDVVGMVFYEGGEFNGKGLSVKVDKGCVLMVSKTGKNSYSVHIADPGQKQDVIRVEISAGRKSGSLDCDFTESGIYAGATKAYNIQLN